MAPCEPMVHTVSYADAVSRGVPYVCGACRGISAVLGDLMGSGMATSAMGSGAQFGEIQI
ncbi:hypothetical protein M514_13198 [Trichuris suis]|uniref:Uncharacterized protein n=1 Tax=Trichuris suis TaxID=68888 RepID=A0A085MTN9_9BILA|nr:hypothetical protein M513_13198 [Trichuris suis]KFD60585.1 hypothetical protein M514_13198 [Trichuris suis]